ncbi:hypothetical protein FO519_000264 [Halicephalobus sp. NKZ332]|nr:hypothetical protein FO519_000264 [Halicephalobus sp. NKZ332]
MDQQSTSSHPLINSNFASAAAGLQSQLTAGLGNATGNVDNNQLLSRLQLSFSNAASSLLPSSFGSQLTNDFYNQQGTWQAKVAAMLPVYNSVLNVGDPQTQLESIMEQSLKASGLNLGSQQTNAFTNGVNPFSNVPIMAAVAAAASNSIPTMPNQLFPQTNTQIQIPSTSQTGMTQQQNLNSQSNMMPTTSNSFSSSSSNLPLDADQQKSLFSSQVPPLQKNQSVGASNPQNSTSDSFNVSAIISLAQAKLTSPTKNLTFSGIPSSSGSMISPTFSSFLPTTTSNQKETTVDDLLDLEVFNPSHNLGQNSSLDPLSGFQSSVSSNIQNSMQLPTSSMSEPKSDKPNNTASSRELDTEKELDQWLSMAVEGHLSPEEAGSPEGADLFGAEATGFSLDPIMFTPPDSPQETKQQEDRRPQNVISRMEPLHIRQPLGMDVSKPQKQPEMIQNRVPPPMDPLVFLPKTQRRVSNNRIPVYKRKASALPVGTTLEKALEKVSKPKMADEYSFTDEDEEEPIKPSISLPPVEEVEDKFERQPSPSAPEVAEPPRKKPHIEETVETKLEERVLEPIQNQLVKIIRRRREQARQLESTSNGISVPPIRLRDGSIDRRLACLGPASGDSPKGTFVVCKLDVFKPDCPLWKVDNQNLLQKYPQFFDFSGSSKIIRYKNSSTYSGWCDQVATGYLVVRCKYLKHTRAESIVEPEIPIADLIPAVTEFGQGSEAFGLVDEPASDDVFEPISSTLAVTKDMIRLHMRSFTQAMLRHAVTMNFLQEVKADNNWDYLVALNEIETMTSYGKQKINEKVRWGQHFEVALTIYPNITATDPDLVTEGDICQACGDDLASKSIQVYSNDSYDYESMASEKLPELDADSTHPAIEYSTCYQCCRFALLYHKLHHMKFSIFRHCEDLLETVSYLRPELSPEAIITLCLSRRSWQRKLISDYATLWRKIQDNDL